MVILIPPLDFSHSPSSFCTAAESPVISQNDLQSSKSSLDVFTEKPSAPAKAVNVDDEAAGAERFVELKRHSAASNQPKKLVKRNVSQKAQKLLGSGSRKGWKGYRCAIHATSGTDFTAAETECKRLITESGGIVNTDFVCPGGFFYQLPPFSKNPLEDGDKTERGGYVEIADWTPLPKPIFSAFKLMPYHAADRTISVSRRATIAGPEQLLLAVKPVGARKSVVAKRTVSVWLGMMARDYGRAFCYVA